MKIKLFLTLALLAFSVPAFAVFTIGNGDKAGSANTNTVAIAGFDTTGATIIFACSSTDGAFQIKTPGAVTDNKGNYWQLAAIGTHDETSALWFTVPTTVGSNHIISFNPGVNGSKPSLSAQAFVGTSTNTFDRWRGYGTSASGGADYGNQLTPSEDNALIIACVSADADPSSINSSFTVAQHINVSGGAYYGNGMAYQIQTTATARNPSWSWSGGNFAALSMASFKLSSAVSSTFVLVSSTIKKSTDNASVTTDAIDTTDAIAIVGCMGNDGTTHNISSTWSDSASNSWTAGTYASSAESGVKAFYVLNPTTSATHTFTFTNATTNYPVIAVFALKRPGYLITFDQAAQTAGGTQQSTGSLTPAATGELMVLCAHQSDKEATYFTSTGSSDTTNGGDVQPMLNSFVRTATSDAKNYHMTAGIKFLPTTSAVTATVNGAGSNAAILNDLFGGGAAGGIPLVGYGGGLVGIDRRLVK